MEEPHPGLPLRRRPDFGDDERFDRRLHRLRQRAWVIIVPALLAAAFLYRVPGVAVESSVLRAVIIYGAVLAGIRIAGKRTMAELTAFDLVVLLIVSEAVQPALVADDRTLTNAMVLVMTIIALDAALGMVKDRFPRTSKWLDDVPTVLVREGDVDRLAMRRMQVDEDDILEAARRRFGLTRIEEIRFAVLERTGGISIVPWNVNPRVR